MAPTVLALSLLSSLGFICEVVGVAKVGSSLRKSVSHRSFGYCLDMAELMMFAGYASFGLCGKNTLVL
jgi:hypothetical protein